MAMKPGLRIRQTQRLTLTPALRQSISVLGLSSAALEELVERELEQNPLISLEQSQQGTTISSFEFAIDTVASAPSLIENLHQQIIVNSTPGPAQNIAFYLAGNLTDQGYLPNTTDALAAELGLERDLVQTAVAILQSCEPTGIGAYGLKQCLELQLVALGETRNNRQIILQNLDDFAVQDWGALRKSTGLSNTTLHQLGKTLMALNPHPADKLEPQPIEYMRPDVIISANQNGGFDVELARSVAPSLRVDQHLFESALASDPSTQTYLQTHLDRSNSLIRAIEVRSKTILRVCQSIVVTQHRFFSDGHNHLVPHTRAKLAETLDLHPSTVSRAVANKSLECPLGIFPLRFFFTSSLNPLGTNMIRSAYSVQQEIRKLINGETAAEILSDERITALLRQSGVDIARRTVAKYRQCLNIPTSAQRRRSKRVL